MRSSVLGVLALSWIAATSGPIGIDLGSVNSVTAAPRRGGVDVLVNEASRRQTPSIVAFDERQRLLGQSASVQLTSSPQSCASELKSLLCVDRETLQALLPRLSPTVGVDPADASEEVWVELPVHGSPRRFSPTQLVAMLLHKLYRCAEHELGAPPTDCALAVPLRFSAEQRQAVLDAAQIAGLRGVHLLSDGAAVALDYALGRNDLEADAERHVAFIDAGHSGVQACVARIRSDSVELLSHASAADVGGAALDELLLDHFAVEFQERFKIDARSTPRATTRLRQACEKLRRVLSANRDGTVSLDCLVGETDVHGSLSRDALEQMAAPLIGTALDACQRAIDEAGLKQGAALDAVELVGGFSRMPAFVAAVRDQLGIEPSRTLNAEESVARGAALAAAMRSRSFRMRPMVLREGLLHETLVRCEGGAEGGGAEPMGHRVLPRGTRLPTQQRVVLRSPACAVSITCTGADAARRLACSAALPTVSEGKGSSASPESSLLVQVDIDENQLPSITAFEEVYEDAVAGTGAGAEGGDEPDAATTHTPPEEPQGIELQGGKSQGAAADGKSGASDDAGTQARGEADADAQGASSDGDAEPDDSPAPSSGSSTDANATTADAPAVRLTRLDVTELARLGASDMQLEEWSRLEAEMRSEDAAVERTLAAKNELEAQIYARRASLGEEESLGAYVTDDERSSLLEQLEQLEDWLYGDGEHVSASEYQGTLEKLEASMAYVEDRMEGLACLEKALQSLEATCKRLARRCKVDSLVDAGQLPSSVELAAAVQKAEAWAVRAREALLTHARHSALPHSAGECSALEAELTVQEAQVDAEEKARADSEAQARAEAKAKAAEAEAEASNTKGGAKPAREGTKASTKSSAKSKGRSKAKARTKSKDKLEAEEDADAKAKANTEPAGASVDEQAEGDGSPREQDQEVQDCPAPAEEEVTGHHEDNHEDDEAREPGA